MPNKEKSKEILLIRLSDTVRHDDEERRTLDFKTEYFQIWQLGWGMHKKYFGISADDEQKWQQLDKECEQIDQKYAGQPERKFLQSLLLAVCAELERESKHEEN